MQDFLPVIPDDMHARGWREIDFVVVTGDAYVDHPSFGAALIARLLESRGYRIGIIAQPDWKTPDEFRRFGRPRLGFLVTAGNVDSMVNHFTPARHRRKRDAYSPGGVTGRRPDRAVTVYAQCARGAYPGIPVIIGGLEASLRRFAHYDYWSDTVRKSVLLDSRADLLVYGMGERAVLEIAKLLGDGVPVRSITGVRGTVYRRKAPSGRPDPVNANSRISVSEIPEAVFLPAYENVRSDRKAYARSFLLQHGSHDANSSAVLIEPCGESWVVQNPPAAMLSERELDEIYELPYTRDPHPMYDGEGGVPAIEEVRFSLVSSRGCFGSCSFCSLNFHQGRIVQGRSHDSVLREAEALTAREDFKGFIHDVGGPTANFRQAACAKQVRKGACPDRQCLYPEPCPNLIVEHRDYLSLLRKLRKHPRVKKVFIRSGIRYDYLMADPDGTFFRELCEHHISGQLKVAPEHVSRRVLDLMGKPGQAVFDAFVKRFRQLNRELGKRQFLVPYLISGHPGSTLADAIQLAEYLRDHRMRPEQVQDFYPTPGTLATCMYHTEIDPRTGKAVHVARGLREKAMQRALVQYNLSQNRRLVTEALVAAGRRDLIGYGPKFLVTPERPRKNRVSGTVPGRRR